MSSLHFFDEILGIKEPWKVASVSFDGIDTVNIELEYDRSLRPSAPDCPECGGKSTYYDTYKMIRDNYRRTVLSLDSFITDLPDGIEHINLLDWLCDSSWR